jgi:transposase
MMLAQPVQNIRRRWQAAPEMRVQDEFEDADNVMAIRSPCGQPEPDRGRGIRPIAIGKKNWLFAGSERAGRRVAAIQSLLGTAKLNGLDPHAWLRDTLEKLPICPNSRIDELLPLRPERP